MAEQPTRRSLFGGLPVVVLLLAAVAAAGYGGYLVISDLTAGYRPRSIGIFLIGLGLMFLPIPLIAIFGAIVCIGAAIYAFYLGYTLQAVVFVIVGLISLSDHVQALALQRQLDARRGE
jgi:hypothetical protein